MGTFPFLRVLIGQVRKDPAVGTGTSQEDEMFDKMIESNSAGAEFKPRRTYFLVSSIVVGTLFLAAVVVSIYAGDIGLGNTDFELSELLAPLETAAPEPQPEPEVVRPTQDPQTMADHQTRIVNMARVDEVQPSPNSTSVEPSQFRSRPIADFELGNADSEPVSNVGTNRSIAPSGGSGLAVKPEPRSSEDKPEAVPAPPVSKPKPAPPKNVGVVNGIAISLPKPPYPAIALSINIQGKVDVQVTIDETGRVISARAASGHPFLRPAAEKAASNARFSPTLVSGVPVKVTGVIIYNFTRN